jgi:cytochrome c553
MGGRGDFSCEARRRRPAAFDGEHQEMKKLLGSMLLLLVSLAACGDDETSTTTNGGDKDVSDVLALLGNGNVMDGQQVYLDSCAEATCHGADGDSGPQSKKLSEAVPIRSDKELAEVIRYGTINEGGIMPEQKQLSAQDIADVITFLRQQFPAT